MNLDGTSDGKKLMSVDPEHAKLGLFLFLDRPFESAVSRLTYDFIQARQAAGDGELHCGALPQSS